MTHPRRYALEDLYPCRIQVQAVYSAEEALLAVQQAGWIPQLTIVDVFLPGMNGIDLAILLKTECPDCCISLLSGQSGAADLIEAAAQQGHTFPVLPKPMHPAELLEFSASLLDTAARSRHTSQAASPSSRDREPAPLGER